MKANTAGEVKAGDIAALVGMKNTTTGNTLCDVNNPVLLESIDFPEPVISLAIEPKTKSDQDKMGIALQRLAEEDPTFQVSSNEDTGQTIIAGMGELHLEIIIDRLFRGSFGKGSVVDFVSVSQFPTFNVADASITIGVILLIIAVVFKK